MVGVIVSVNPSCNCIQCNEVPEVNLFFKLLPLELFTIRGQMQDLLDFIIHTQLNYKALVLILKIIL